MKFDRADIEILKMDDLSSQRWHQILQLRSEAFVVEQRCVYPDPDDLDAIAHHAFLLQEHEVLAYARFYQNEEWHLGRVVTKHKARGKGYSRLLIARCMEVMKETNQELDVTLSAQVYLHDFYASFGFKAVDSMYLEDGIPHLKMVIHGLRKTDVKNS